MRATAHWKRTKHEEPMTAMLPRYSETFREVGAEVGTSAGAVVGCDGGSAEGHGGPEALDVVPDRAFPNDGEKKCQSDGWAKLPDNTTATEFALFPFSRSCPSISPWFKPKRKSMMAGWFKAWKKTTDGRSQDEISFIIKGLENSDVHTPPPMTAQVEIKATPGIPWNQGGKKAHPESRQLLNTYNNQNR